MVPMMKNIKLNILPRQPYLLFTPMPAQNTNATIANATLSDVANTMQQAMIINRVKNIVVRE